MSKLLVVVVLSLTVCATRAAPVPESANGNDQYQAVKKELEALRLELSTLKQSFKLQGKK